MYIFSSTPYINVYMYWTGIDMHTYVALGV